VGSTRSDWAVPLGWPGGVGNEPVAHHAILAVATMGLGIRSQQRVMVPIMSRMALHYALVDSFLLEPSGELSLSDASEHILLAVQRRWCGFLLVDGTSCPTHQQRAEASCSKIWLRRPGPLLYRLEGPTPWPRPECGSIPPHGSSLSRAQAHAEAVHLAGPQKWSACR
jgi:hypothetical protein